jgi:cobalt-zinc-cadmium efflux system outer membrane protein
VDSAAAPLIQKSRAEVEQSTMVIALDSAIRQREIARKNLAVLLGEEQLISVLDNTAFYSINKVLTEKTTTNPDVLKLKATLDRSMARLALEKANVIPDPRFTLGLRNFKESGYQAFVAGISLPIPVLNTNRGNIEKVRSEVSRTEYDNRHVMLLLNAEFHRAQQEMESAYLQADTLQTQILPAAEKAFELAREGYALGRFPYLEVLDAQRSLFGVRQQHIAVLQSFHAARATVERLTAVHLPRIKSTGETHAE